MFHWMTSVHMVVRNHALDNFDTVFCVGPHHKDEIRSMESLYNLPAKNLVECGYGLLDNEIQAFGKMEKSVSECLKILIAPSHQEDNLFESCIDDILSELIPKGYEIIVRPHPQSLRRRPELFTAFQERWNAELSAGRFVFQTDFSSNKTVFEADILITDWSTIAYEYAFTTLRPALFINTKMKVINPEYEKIPLVPTDILWRNQVGASLDKSEIGKIVELIEQYTENPDVYREQILRIRDSSIFNVGESGKAGASYILNRLTKKPKTE